MPSPWTPQKICVTASLRGSRLSASQCGSGMGTRSTSRRSHPDCDPSGMGFVETYSSALKNTRSKSRRRIRIAVVGWAVGLDGRNWAAAWLDLRAQEGLRVETQGCLMLAPDPDGDGWLQRPLACEECNLWLAELLIRRLGRDVPLGNIGSHSL